MTTSRALNGRVDDDDITIVAITVSAAASSGVSSADSKLIGGRILSIVPTGNQDQFVDNVALGSTGIVTVTLAAAATANNTFNVAVQKG